MLMLSNANAKLEFEFLLRIYRFYVTKRLGGLWGKNNKKRYYMSADQQAEG